MDDVRFVPRFVQSGDAKIAYYTWGSGEPLVLLHGNGEDSRYFRGQIPVFARRFRVIAVDSRGHGRSGHGACGLHFAQMADDLKTVFDALGLQRAHILGFSDGGNLAITFALRYPQQVDKLVLNGANLHMLTGVKPAIQLPLYPVVGMLSMLSPLSARLARKRDVLGLMGTRLRRGLGRPAEDSGAHAGDCRGKRYDFRPAFLAYCVVPAAWAAVSYPGWRPFLRGKAARTV